jgi:hypothetical protein
MEVTDATDGDATGDPEDAIYRGVFGVERESVEPGLVSSCAGG